MLRLAMRLVPALLSGGALAAAALEPASVAVLYNSADPASAELAAFYQKARGIPAGNLLGLPMPATVDISREDYNRTLRDPLRKAYSERGWWRMGTDKAGKEVPTANTRPVLAIIRGVPLRIGNTPEGPPAEAGNPLAGRFEAAVDSELLLVGAKDAPVDSVASNYFFKSEKPLGRAELPFLLLTSRIDGASDAVCRRLITESVQVEKTGLWGRGYIDIANKHELGDGWMVEVAKACRRQGIPAVTDRFNETFPKNYPLTDAAIYCGWYDEHVSGPFLNSKLRLRPGAIALHVHSFSAIQLRDPSKNWSAALVERGAAATVGNVAEPYLQLTHHFDILIDRLLRGWSWVEASWAAMPVSSWQGIALGDPLYQPFLHLDGSGTRAAIDAPFRELHRLGSDSEALEKRARDEKSGVLSEAAGLAALADGRGADARKWFALALEQYRNGGDQARQYFNLASIGRLQNDPAGALAVLRAAHQRCKGLPVDEGFVAWLKALDPSFQP